MKKSNTIFWTGFISIWLFFALEIATDIWFGSIYPGYNWKTQSISYLGQEGSPIEHWVLVWGVFFALLIALFTFSFSQIYQSNRWVKIAAISLLVYGLGEGLGSGCFPINPPGTELTLNGRLHNIFSGIGDAGIVLLPFILMFMFPRRENRKLYVYLWTVAGFGMVMAAFFLIAKYVHSDNFISDYKGIWQRIYILNYYALLLVMSVKMLREKRS